MFVPRHKLSILQRDAKFGLGLELDLVQCHAIGEQWRKPE